MITDFTKSSYITAAQKPAERYGATARTCAAAAALLPVPEMGNTARLSASAAETTGPGYMRLVEEADRRRRAEGAADAGGKGGVSSGGKRSLATWHAPDSYAFGVVLWELLTLQQPWEGMGAHEMWLRVRQGERPTLTAADVNGAPEGYVALMRELWHQDPVARPAFAEALRRAREEAE